MTLEQIFENICVTCINKLYIYVTTPAEGPRTDVLARLKMTLEQIFEDIYILHKYMTYMHYIYVCIYHIDIYMYTICMQYIYIIYMS